jgi:hypothetical protein
LAARSPAEAVLAHLEPLKEVVACLTRAAILNAEGYHRSAEPLVLALGDGGPVPLRMRANRLPIAVSVTQQYQVVPDELEQDRFKVTVRGYWYTIETPAGQEILAYHWHPGGLSEVDSCHLHLGPGLKSGLGMKNLGKMHLPSGRVSVEEVVRLALSVDGWGGQPQRSDWEQVLDRNLRLYERLRNWSGSRPLT